MLRDAYDLHREGADNDMFVTGAHGSQNAEEDARVDPLDDVFGSAPASPILGGNDLAGNVEDEADGSSRPRNGDRSDIPRLRSLHVTGGYREGIAVSKEKHMQEGFDEGYTLGAELGLKAGWCLGALEGIGHALAASTVSYPAAEKTTGSDQIDLVTLDSTRKSLEAAEEELKVENLFGRTYFGEDGIWLYHVPGQEREDEETTFEKVAAAHPLVCKWTESISALSGKVGVDFRVNLRDRKTPAPAEAPDQSAAPIHGETPTKSLPKKPSPLRKKLKRSASEPPAEHPEPQAKKRKSKEATAEISPPMDGTKSMEADTAADFDVHCGSCKSWCTCSKGVTYPNPSPEHLSVSALDKAQAGMPVSAMRSTVQTPFPGESMYPSAHVLKQYTDGAELLCQIQAPAQGASMTGKMTQFKPAVKFMQDVITCFPPNEDLPGTVSAVEKVLMTLDQWKQDGSYEALWDAIDEAVNGSPDLLLDFQGFLSEDRRTAGMSELWKTRIERLGFEKTEAAKK
ncbi:hypothetical protein KC354_g4435 [Hortaea werneckii]|nr:hypothetical protein KC354_g4435 [Hortaea werneckii]